MTRTKGSNHPVARRVAMASATVLAASGIGMLAAPMAFGQIVIPIGGSSQSAGVTNSGSASANSGGNVAVGNNSTNTVTAGGGGLLSVPLDLLSTTNTSDGAAVVATGPATATGNSAQTNVGQSNGSGNTVNSFLAGQNQSARVTNAGSASANSGGNAAIGNNSTNTVTAGGAAAGVGVSLGGAVNNSTGNAAVSTGAANAAGNTSATNVGQSSGQGGGQAAAQGGGAAARPGPGAVSGIGGAAPCGSGRFASFQDVEVRNQGQARADTGNNVAIGNNSTNDFSAGQTVSGGLVGVGINIGGPVNNSSGTAVITTGPATAVGNNSVTQVGQSQTCPQVTTLSAAGRPGVIVPAGRVQARTGALARTGLDTADLGMIAGAMLGGGMLLIASQRRRMAARSAPVPMAGLGFGLGGDR